MSRPTGDPKYNRQQLLRVAAVTERQLRAWEKLGLIPDVPEYGWAELTAVQTLVKLSKAKFGPKRIHTAIGEIQRKIRGVTNPLSELNVLVDHGRIHVHVDGHRMEAVSGQLLLNFDAGEINRLLAFPTDKQNQKQQRERTGQAADWFQRGLDIEQAGLPADQAMEAYEKALELDPNCLGAMVNLGTLFYQSNQLKKAEAWYRKALDVEPEYALAHFNLANLHDERGSYAEALHHYATALNIAPSYADAHYNMALLCQRTGQTMKAVQHWRTYLKLDPASTWADVARRELAKLRDAAVVRREPPGRVVS